ncbi:hypothetical protein CEUSTIGMA_g4043.t1 [Chlamydomonas eustigma]|uniref:CobW/HypB/UreG nucleotide-binding domain-containing protein n=1 Tax=Chlamydomonas eustigma TaxID=1157962 RepID=A0A250X0K1_9CHLO|nr:hypothetical protein CEUSTIGMA_g4043.t1 [Chlamydomonas eustigma]|eukprot:GAX76597.1 hypothetical protein CEUSTIGMA_g4043.t1 [Chlamydomonas eustigma]
MKLPIPVNIITGGLGSGKTTTISYLLRLKITFAPTERWAILVNEFGALGIDGSLLDAASSKFSSEGSVVVKELAGGCLCCTLSGPLGVAIAQLVRNSKPDRLIIEPSGLGHPAGLLDTLRSEHLQTALTVQAILCLVDVRLIGVPEFGSNQAYQDQMNVADIIIGTKCDMASSEQIEDFMVFSAELYPPKLKVLTTSHGQIEPDLLNEERTPTFQPMFSQAHASRHNQLRGVGFRVLPESLKPPRLNGPDAQTIPSTMGHSGVSDAADVSGPSISSADACEGELSPTSLITPPYSIQVAGGSGGWPARHISNSSPHHLAVGWLFPPDIVFKREALLEVVATLLPVVSRVKGVFRVGKEWCSLQYDEDGGSKIAKLEFIAYRKDSRLEIILPSNFMRAPEKKVDAEEDEGLRHQQQSTKWTELLVALLFQQQWDLIEGLIMEKLAVKK